MQIGDGYGRMHVWFIVSRHDLETSYYTYVMIQNYFCLSVSVSSIIVIYLITGMMQKLEQVKSSLK